MAISCSGAECSKFSSWSFSGADATNTNAGTVYGTTSEPGEGQVQVDIYKDAGRSSLVASGQGGPGSITLT